MATPGLAGRQGVALGHVTRALLVAHEDMADGRVDDGVVDGQDGAAGQAEDGVDPLAFEALDECLRSGELHAAPLSPISKKASLVWEASGMYVGTCDYRRQAPTTTRISTRVVTFPF